MARTKIIIEHPDEVSGIEWIKDLSPEMVFADENQAWRIVEIGADDSCLVRGRAEKQG